MQRVLSVAAADLGSSSKEILTRYTAVAGRPDLPPTWVFGPWKSRDWMQETEETALEDVDEGRRRGLPGTVKLIDASWQAYYQSFTFHSERFPHPERMIRHIRSLGYRLVRGRPPGSSRTPSRLRRTRNAPVAGFSSATPTVSRMCIGWPIALPSSVVAWTSPTLRRSRWRQSHIRRLAQMGVDGFKTDFGEQVPEDAVFADGRTGGELHNVYPRLYNQATADALARETTGILLARSAWHGSQRFSAIFAGDQSSDFGPATGLPSVIVAGQNAGLSGFPYWACDIGGYFGTPTDEVFVRWAQFGAFCPIMQIHGTGCREPWRFSPTTLAIYRRYAQLRMDLLPYIYALAQQAVETGLPMLRALPLEFPDDPGVWDDVAEREYCFGEQLLVAPVYYGLDRFRYLYLPAGGWRDFWTGEWRQGGRVHQVPVDLETLPVHARAGAIIPWLDPSARYVRAS